MAVIFMCSVAASLVSALDFNVFRGNDGLVYFTVGGRVLPLSAYVNRPDGDLTVVEVPRASPQVVVDDSGREILTGSQIYSKVVPSVVGIISSYGVGGSGATGTGIILSEDGVIATNNHVVSGATGIRVVFADGTEYDAVVLGRDSFTDLAALKIQATGLTPAELGSSDSLEPGDPAYAIGNPLGLELRNTITDGLISAINRDIAFSESGVDMNMTVIQTSCAVNPGNSGGPLCNQYGQIVGIISSKIMGDVFNNVEGLGFAIPMSMAQPILNDLITLGYVSGRPAIGITADISVVLDERTAAHFGLPVGVVVDSVTPGSDAEAKGIIKGDIVTHVNGIAVKTVAEINNIKNEYKVGDVLILTIYRSGNTFDLDIVLMESR